MSRQSREDAIYESTGFWTYAWRFRRKTFLQSWDFFAAVLIGILVDVVLFARPHESIVTVGAQTMTVAFFAITGGFLATTLSVLVGMIPRPVAAANGMQFLNVIFDFAWTVGAIYLAAASWICAAFMDTEHGQMFMAIYSAVKGWLPFISAYALFATFAGLQRLFRLAVFATIHEELGESCDVNTARTSG